jgi:hypothetical protein
MTVISKLACSLGRRDEVPNQELARRITRSKTAKADIKELVDNLTNKDKNIQNDCIKVLYEIGAERPDLIADYEKEFLNLLESRNNRLAWGAMTALDYIASINPARIYKHLGKIMMASDKGSVITKDHAIGILIKLAAEKKFAKNALALLLDQFRSCATNQLPMYAENAHAVISDHSKENFINVLTARLADLEKESQRRRVKKVIAKLGK